MTMRPDSIASPRQPGTLHTALQNHPGFEDRSLASQSGSLFVSRSGSFLASAAGAYNGWHLDLVHAKMIDSRRHCLSELQRLDSSQFVRPSAAVILRMRTEVNMGFVVKMVIFCTCTAVTAACGNLHGDDLFGHEGEPLVYEDESLVYEDQPAMWPPDDEPVRTEACDATSVGMSVRLLDASTGAELACAQDGRNYKLEVYGPSQNFAYCLEDEDGFSLTSGRCKDATNGDVVGLWAYTLEADASLPPSGMTGVVKPGCGGADTFVESFEFNFPDCAAGSSQVPEMTSNNTPHGRVTRSGVYSSSSEAWLAFESNNAAWVSKTWQSPAWISYEWDDGPRMITSYSIKFTNGSLTGRAPRDWTLQGWTGTSWIVLDSQSGQTNWAGVETRAYTVSAPGSYTRYRLHVTRDNDSRSDIVAVSIGYLQLFGVAGGGAYCGDGFCSGNETPFNCPADCGVPSFCGDGICNPNENLMTCPEDCQLPCPLRIEPCPISP